MISAMLFTAQILSNVSKATVIEQKSTVKLYSKGELICLVYNGIKIGTQFVVYEKDGKEYPAYCVNREKDGVTEDYSYDVIAENIYSNNLVWNAVINGYPFKTPQELGCNTEIEAFTATKLAIYDMLYDYDMSKFNICANNGQIVLNAMRQIREKARNSNESKKIATIKIIAESIGDNINIFLMAFIPFSYNVSMLFVVIAPPVCRFRRHVLSSSLPNSSISLCLSVSTFSASPTRLYISFSCAIFSA